MHNSVIKGGKTMLVYGDKVEYEGVITTVLCDAFEIPYSGSIVVELEGFEGWINAKLPRKIGVEELIMNLRKYHQMDIYTVDKQWVVQLFELDTCPNDIGISCDFETSGESLNKVLTEALEWSKNSVV